MSNETIFYMLVVGFPALMVAILIFGKDADQPDETPAGQSG